MLETIYAKNSEQCLWEKDLKKLFIAYVCAFKWKEKITYFYVYIYLLIIGGKKK